MLNCTTFSYATMWNDGIKCWERKQVNISGNVGKYDLFAVCCYQRDGRLIGATIKQSMWFLFLSGITAIPPKVHIRLIFSKIIQRPETSISNYSHISSL